MKKFRALFFAGIFLPLFAFAESSGPSPGAVICTAANCTVTLASGSTVGVTGTVTLGPSAAVIGAVTQSGTWAVGRTWTLSNGTDSVQVSGTVGITAPAAGAWSGSVGYAQGSTASGEYGELGLGAVTTNAPSDTNLTAAPISLSAGGALRVLNGGVGGQISVAVTSNNVTGNGAGQQIGLPYLASPVEQATGAGSDAQGNQYGAAFVDTEALKPSYISSFSVTPGAAGIFAQICGPASGATRLRAVTVQGDAMTAGLVTLVATKASAAATGGTSTGVTPTPMDATNDSADTASVLSYSGQPTAGATVGVIGTQFYYVPLAANVGPAAAMIFGNAYDMQAVVLRSASQCVEFSAAGTLPNGSAFIVNIYDTRE